MLVITPDSRNAVRSEWRAQGLVVTHDKVYQTSSASTADAMKNTLIYANKNLNDTKMGNSVKSLETRLPKKALFGFLAPPLTAQL